MLSLRKVKKLITPTSEKLNVTMKKLSSIHLLPSCCCCLISIPLRRREINEKSKSTIPIPVESDEKGPWPWGRSTTQPRFPTTIVKGFPFSDEKTSTSPCLVVNRLRRTRKILDFHSLSVGNHHIANDNYYPPFSVDSSSSLSSASVNGLWSEPCIGIPPLGESDGFCFICQQPREFLAPVADTKEEGGSFNSFSTSPSPRRPVVPRKRPLTVKDGKGQEEAEGNEPAILLDDEVHFPVIPTYHHVIPSREKIFFSICQQPKAGLPLVADPKHEDGSFAPESKRSLPQADDISPSPSPPLVLRPRNRPMLCEERKDDWEEDGDESTILWDEFDSPLVSPPPVLLPDNRLSPCEVEERDDDEESEGSDDKSVIRLWANDDPFVISPSPSMGLLRRDGPPLICNLRKRKDDEDSDESTILWDEVPQSLRPRHRATTIPLLTEGKGKEKEKGQSNKQEEGTKEETKEKTKEETTKADTKEEDRKADTKSVESKEDRFGWAVNSLNDTADEEIWLSSGMNYPF